MLKKKKSVGLEFTARAEYNYRRDKLWTPVIHLNGRSVWAGAGVKTKNEAEDVAERVVVNTFSRLFDKTDGYRRVSD